MVVLAFLKLLGCLGLLMYGTRLMGESLQQLAGDRLRHILDSLTTNRFTSLLTGALVTAMIQSSTAASLMTAHTRPSPAYPHGSISRQYIHRLDYGRRIQFQHQ